MTTKWPVWRVAAIGAAGGMFFQLFRFIVTPLPAGVAGNAVLAQFVGQMLGALVVGAVGGALAALIRNAMVSKGP